MVFHWSLSDSKSPQVSMTLLSILTNLNNVTVWKASIRPLISKSSSPFTNWSFSECTKSTNYNWYSSHFHVPQFFNSLVRSRYLSFFTLSFSFTLWSSRTAKSTILQVLFLLLIIIRSSCLSKIRWSVCMSRSQRSLSVLFSRTDAGLWIYHLFVWSNFNFLHNSLGITLLTQLCLVLHTFCANLLHSHITWLIVSSLKPHKLHLLFCCILSIVAFIWFVLIALFCATISRDSVSLLKFPFLRYIHIFLCEILLISHLKRP